MLDVGCGDGRLTAEIRDLIPKGRIIGIDASPNMVSYAKEIFPKNQYPNLDFELTKAEDINFACSFDSIVSFSCFHWIREPERAIYRLTNALKQNGELLILTYPKESIFYEFLQEALEQFPEYSDLSSYYTMLTIEQYEKLLNDNGLNIKTLALD